MVLISESMLTVDGVAEAFVSTICIRAENGMTPSLTTETLNLCEVRSKNALVLPEVMVGRVSGVVMDQSSNRSTSKSLRYSLFAMLASFAPEMRANRVCEGPVVAVQLIK